MTNTGTSPRRQATTRRRFLEVAGAGSLSLAVGACSDPEPGTSEGEGDTSTSGGPPPDLPSMSDEPDLSPIVANEDFFVRTKDDNTPTVDVETWKLEIDGAVETPVSLSMADLEALGAVDKEYTIACISSLPEVPEVGNARWSGRPLAEVLAAAGVSPTGAAIELHFESADGYQTALPISDLTDRELWLVWRMNDEPLPVDHGFPVRLLVPRRYGMKCPKWLTRLTFGTEALLGTWESFGFSNDATQRPGCLFLSPSTDGAVPLEVLALQGCAYCSSTVTKVEVSVDGGEQWHEAEVTYGGPEDTWTLWRYDWLPPGTGTYEVLARIECSDGQQSDPNGVASLEGYAGYGTLELEVV